jgi:hypothetical protein
MNLAVCPAVTVWLAGWVVIVGATAVDVPVPLRLTMVAGLCGSLLVMVIDPVALPAVEGVNDTLKLALPPGAIVLGVVMPVTPNELPLTEINETTRFAPPVLLIVTGPLVVDPVATLPKFRLVVLKLILCGEAVAEPVSVTAPETPVLVCTVNVPVAFPGAVGSNHTWNALDCPTGRDMGMARPVMENCPLDTAAELTLTNVFPVLATEAVRESLCPTTALPKLRLPGVTWIAPFGGGLVPLALTSPEQPLIIDAAARTTIARSARSCKSLLNSQSRIDVRSSGAWCPNLATLIRRHSFAG